jgi:hypothetical protein
MKCVMGQPFDTVWAEATSEAEARQTIDRLVAASQWFEVTPCSDDKWVICVKPENTSLLPVGRRQYPVGRCPGCS